MSENEEFAAKFPNLHLLEQVTPVLNRILAYIEEQELLLVPVSLVTDGESVFASSLRASRHYLEEAVGINQTAIEDERRLLIESIGL